MTEPNWITEARKLIGVHEGVGNADNPIVVELFKDAGHPEIVHDSTAWCAAFIGAVLNRSGHKGNGSLWALDYAKWGQPLLTIALGAVVTKKRFNKKGQLVGGHVFFAVGWDKNNVFGLGGNQSDTVSIVKYPRSVITAFRWPSDAALPGNQPETLAEGGGIDAAGSES
ncbi:MAG: TIGR02594 family protein [Methylococcaceae bacterium]|jgi:uncharacterized protein (TIGR02594 family)